MQIYFPKISISYIEIAWWCPSGVALNRDLIIEHNIYIYQNLVDLLINQLCQVKKSEDTPIYPSSLWPTLVTLHRRRGTGNTPWLCLRPWGRRRSTDLVSWSRGKLWFGGKNQEMSWHVHLGKWLMVEVGWSWLKNRLLCKTDRSLKSSYYHPGVHWFQDQSDYWKWPL